MVPSLPISTQSPSSSLFKTSPETLTCGNELFFLPEVFHYESRKTLDSNETSSVTRTLLPLDSDRGLCVTKPRIGVLYILCYPLKLFHASSPRTSFKLRQEIHDQNTSISSGSLRLSFLNSISKISLFFLQKSLPDVYQ